MIKTEKGYISEPTGREMDTIGCEGFSIFDGIVDLGKEFFPEFFNQETKSIPQIF